MYVSRETPQQVEARLRRVVSSAERVWHEGAYVFIESPADRFPDSEIPTALAIVRDDDVWSVLTHADDGAAEPFSLFSFHFPPGLDNSGFVGWLASRFKEALGTGVFVVCGQNIGRGGIFDYWGVPLTLKADAQHLLAELRGCAIDD